MKYQVRNLSVLQTSKVAGLFFFILSALFFIPLGIYSFIKMGSTESFILFLFPFFYLIAAYISVAASCLIYNFIASYFGGVEVILSKTEESATNNP